MCGPGRVRCAALPRPRGSRGTTSPRSASCACGSGGAPSSGHCAGTPVTRTRNRPGTAQAAPAASPRPDRPRSLSPSHRRQVRRHDERRHRCRDHRGRSVRPLPRRAPGSCRRTATHLRPADGVLARTHARGDAPQVSGLRLEPVRPAGYPHSYQVLPVDQRSAGRLPIARRDGAFDISLATGERARARSVVVAVGVQHFAHVPEPLSGLPGDLVSHSSAHADLSVFRGRDVLVLGAGQSALESAALLRERGTRVRVMARGLKLVWNGEPLPPRRPLTRRLREPETALGSGWRTWFYANHPALFRRLPAGERVRRARTALGPAGAWWLRRRIEGQVPVLLGHMPFDAQPIDGGVRLQARTTGGRTVEIVTEHVIVATGYRADVARLPFVGPSLRARIRPFAGGPYVNVDFESSVPGLYFIGPAVASSFGPAMRFVWGADFAARVLTQRFGRAAGLRPPVGWRSGMRTQAA